MNQKAQKIPQMVAVLLFVGLSLWWGALALFSQAEDFSRYVFGASYGLMALFGGLYGLVTAKKWGGYKSSLGRAILYLAVGLLLAEFGQIVFSYYNIVKEELVPYPSIADIGFFGSIPLYILGALSLAKVLGVSASIRKNPLKLVAAVLVAAALLFATYRLFLQGYVFSEVDRLTAFLDLGYPLGQAIYVMIALIILLNVAKALGGVMRKPLFILLAAFVLQYVADFNFLYQNLHETWVNGAYGDYLYLLAYFVMTLSLVSLSSAFGQRSTPETKSEPVLAEPVHES